MVVLGSEYDNLGGTPVCTEPLYEEFDKWLGYDRIPDTIGSIEVKGFQLSSIDGFRFFHIYDALTEKYPEATCEHEKQEMCVKKKGLEHKKEVRIMKSSIFDESSFQIFARHWRIRLFGRRALYEKPVSCK